MFISHASADKELVDSVVDLLETGVAVPGDEIFASSVEGRDIPSSVDYRGYIRERLETAAAVIFLLTPEFYRSPFCMAELGAAWMVESDLFVFVVPPIERQDIHDVLGNRQIEELDKARSLNKLFDFLQPKFGGGGKVARWEAKRTTFTKYVKTLTAAAASQAAAHDRGVWTEYVVDGTLYIANNGYATIDLKSAIIGDLKAGGVLPTVYAYLTSLGYHNWISLTDDPGNVYFRDAVELYKSHSRTLAKTIIDAVGDELDIISLGPGNGQKDLLLLRSLARLRDASKLYYYPFDVNEGMIATSMRLVGGDQQLRTISVKAMLADFSSLSQFKFVYQYRRAPNVFLFLGNTLGNLDNDMKFLAQLRTTAMATGDLLVVEVRNQSLRTDPEQDLGAEDRNKRFDFGPLEFIGVPYRADNLKYEVLENQSVVPGTLTTVARYKVDDIPGVEHDEVILSYIHRYERDALRQCIERLGLKLLDLVENGSSTALVLQKS
ncbi:MAG TPA: L-histidine N(alpha)-methyltransferase [Solirubrobacteraceae bacterium]|nr:L-histidine N(alpha)-methyltransferase [Solirubrobacteraceae bacterium]